SKVLERNYIDYDILEMKNLLKEFVIIELKMSYNEIRSLCQIGMYFLYQKNKKHLNKSDEEIIVFLDDLKNKVCQKY
ncbi:MAG: hypothetical protein ACRCZR_04850, partial [Cetobacterium sp.]